MSAEPAEKGTRRSNGPLRRALLLSVLAALLTMGLKTLAWWWTGSVSLLSDALESVINLAAASVAFLAITYASRPVDLDHTYGHEKIEFFSSGLEGTLIFVAALGIGWSAIARLLSGQPLESLGVGLALSTLAALINLAVAQLLLRRGREYGSIVLEADGHHLMTDVWTSGGVLVGLGLVWMTQLYWLDPVLALAIALNILWTGFSLVRRSFHGLMDRALPELELTLIRQTITEHLQPGMTFHALRTRQAGSRWFADFHLLVPGKMTVSSAHVQVDRIEDALRAVLPQLEVTIHLEPIEEEAAWTDSALLQLEPGSLLKENTP